MNVNHTSDTLPAGRRLSDCFFIGVTVAFFLFVGVSIVNEYGRSWTWEPHGVPTLLLACDGTHHPDGTIADPILTGLARSGHLEGAMLILALSIGVLLLFAIHFCWSFARKRQRLASLLRAIADLEGRESAKP